VEGAEKGQRRKGEKLTSLVVVPLASRLAQTE